uniref:Retinol dehydrogenase 1 n=2 Tax=Erpetoichthys calabaricus TaxID=27687 RepID=A0A8C4TA83_ERPCA
GEKYDLPEARKEIVSCGAPKSYTLCWWPPRRNPDTLKEVDWTVERIETRSCLLDPPCLALAACALLTALVWFVRDSLKISDIDQKYVFITGCDSGFGNQLAKQLDRQGFRVIAACLTEKGAAELKTSATPRLKTVLLNVVDGKSIDEAVVFVKAEVGEEGLWGLVNNAGILLALPPTDWIQIESFRKVIDVNLLGTIEVTLKFLPLVKKARGRIVNVSSIMGRLAFGGGGYCISKFGVESFSDTLRKDMKHFDIKVSIIEPGFFKTQITNVQPIEKELRRLWSALTPEIKSSYGTDYIDRYLKAQNTSMNLLLSSKTSHVTDCMQHALTAKYPRTRYGAGWDAKLLWLPLSYLPTALTDRVIRGLLPDPAESGVTATRHSQQQEPR